MKGNIQQSPTEIVLKIGEVLNVDHLGIYFIWP
jgi:hypothetical protein